MSRKRSSGPSLFTPRPRATFSDCAVHPPGCALDCKERRYRYTLEWPTEAPNGDGTALFILANPSTATHLKPDPTVTRCITYARDWGYAWCAVGNVRAWRETHPERMPADPEAVGPDTDSYLVALAVHAEIVVCGWGKLGGARGPAVLALLRGAGVTPHALALNADGSPQHPLYLKRTLRPVAL